MSSRISRYRLQILSVKLLFFNRVLEHASNKLKKSIFGHDFLKILSNNWSILNFGPMQDFNVEQK
jgi:hypothetical protein